MSWYSKKTINQILERTIDEHRRMLKNMNINDNPMIEIVLKPDLMAWFERHLVRCINDTRDRIRNHSFSSSKQSVEDRLCMKGLKFDIKSLNRVLEMIKKRNQDDDYKLVLNINWAFWMYYKLFVFSMNKPIDKKMGCDGLHFCSTCILGGDGNISALFMDELPPQLKSTYVHDRNLLASWINEALLDKKRCRCQYCISCDLKKMGYVLEMMKTPLANYHKLTSLSVWFAHETYA